MKKLGTVKISGWDSQGPECRSIAVNTSTIRVGYKRFSRERVRAALKRGRGCFICEGWKYNWKTVKGGTISVAAIDRFNGNESLLSLSPLLVSKIRAWAKP